MSVNNSILVLLLIYLLSLVDISSTECVPVFMWGNIRYNELVSPLKKINQESFTNIFENELDKKSPLVVFLEQSLSPEDFLLQDSNGNSIFSTLAPLKQSTSVNYWSCVKNPITSITSLKERNVIKTSVNSVLNESFKLTPGDILVVDLNDANEEEDRIDMLQRHDLNMASIYSYLLKDHKDLVLLFTAYRPSWIISEEVRSHRKIRETNKADEPTPPVEYVVYENSDILLSAIASPILSNNETTVSLADFKVRTNNKTEEEMDVIFESPTITHITLTFKFLFGGGYWILNNIIVFNTTAPADQQEYYFRCKDLYAPEVFSYHCTNLTLYYPRNVRQNIRFEESEFQVYVEPTNATNNIFGSSYDCVGFMSAPIWSGIFVTFILVLIMTCGLTMMMDIKTMDRFDDPKGKTITVTATE